MSVGGGELSDTTRRMRDQEQHDLADEAYRAAFALIESERAKLTELAEKLLADEVLDRAEIDRIMADVAPSARGLRVAAASARPLQTRPE
jgi:cell division protease FtsH